MVVGTLFLLALGAPVTAGQHPPGAREMLADAVTSPSPLARPAPAAAPADGTTPSRPRPRQDYSHRTLRPIADEDELDERPVRNPKWGLMFEFGLGGGGDNLVTVSLSDGSTQTLSAGDGSPFRWVSCGRRSGWATPWAWG